MMHRFTFLLCALTLTLSPFGLHAQSSSPIKAKVAEQLEAIQQDVMDLQNAVLAYHETGHCVGCQNKVSKLENHIADVAWFLASEKPSYLRLHLAPSVNTLQTWLNEPDAVSNVHHVLGDLMTRSAYEFLLLGDVKWDASFWARAQDAWPRERATLGLSAQALKRADRGFKKAVRGR